MFPTKPLYVITHVIGWLLFFSLMLAFTSSFDRASSFSEHLFSLPFIIFALVYLAVFYFNSYFLVPRLYFKNKHWLYFFLVVILLFFVFALKPADALINFRSGQDSSGPPPFHEHPFHRPLRLRPRPRIDIVSIILFMMVWVVSTALQILNQWRNTERRAAQAETDRANAELAFLRAQVNPHFLFNTLNNIYALTVTKSEAAPDAIMKLSKIMRYITDEAQQDYVPLAWEEECIRNYIDLQRLRLNEKVHVDYSSDGKLEMKQIAPLILMTFIENVFK